jgi:hypothetical protein
VATVAPLKGKAGDRIRIYLVVGLGLVLAALVYRHLKAKPSENATLPPPSVTQGLAEVADLPALDSVSLKKTQQARAKVKEIRRDSLRDIFAPRRPLKRARPRISRKGAPRAHKAPSLKLTGVIVGGSNSIAIINGKLLRPGERIDGYQVVKVEEKGAFLRSGNRTFKLELAEK